MMSFLPGRQGRRWRRRRRKGSDDGEGNSGAYPTRRCHFCNEVSLIVPPLPPSDEHQDDLGGSSSASTLRRSVGTVQEAWYCSSCRCWNRYDAAQVGGLATWDESMACVASPPPPPPSSRPLSASAPIKSKSLFCHTCQTNQTLVLSMLASHDAEGESDLDDVGHGREREWREALQRRYPPLCKACQPMVQARINERDRMARQLIYKSLLERRARKDVQADGSRGPDDEEKTALRGWNGARGFVWLLCTVSGFLVALHGLVRPVSPNAASAHASLVIASILLGIVSLSYNPSHLFFADADHRRIQGLDVWLGTQHSLLFVRTATLLILSPSLRWPLDETVVRPALSFVSLLLQFWLLKHAFTAVRLRPPQRVTLRSRPVELSDTFSSSRLATDPLAGALPLSLADGLPSSDPMSSALDELLQSPHTAHNGLAQGGQDEEMDWTPTAAASIVPNVAASSVTLGPQRFFGPKEVPTGLEDLFGAALALRDEDDDEQAHEERAKAAKTLNAQNRSIRLWPAALAGALAVAAAIAMAWLATPATGRDLWEAWKRRGDGLESGPAWGFLREMDPA